MNIQQHAIDAQMQSALEAKMRNGYTDKAAIIKTWVNSRKFTLGFNFKQGVNEGDIYINDDGTKCEVLAVF